MGDIDDTVRNWLEEQQREERITIDFNQQEISILAERLDKHRNAANEARRMWNAFETMIERLGPEAP